MASLFIDLTTSTPKLGYALVSDVLGVASRPCVLLSACFPGRFSFLSPFGTGGLLTGVLGTSSVILTGVSCAVLKPLHDALIPLGRLAAATYMAEGLLQLPRFLFPNADLLRWYPTSRTGLATVCLQIPAGAFLSTLGGVNLFKIQPEGRLLALAACLRFMSATLVEPTGPVAHVLYGCGVLAAAVAVVPKRVLRLTGKFLERCAKLASAAFSFVYLLAEKCLPRVRDAVLYVLEHPLMVGLYRRFIEPLWCLVTPWLLPAATSAIAVACCRGVREIVGREPLQLSSDVALQLGGQVFCGAAAVLSSSILTVHAAGRTCRQEHINPLQYPSMVRALSFFANAISWPLSLTTKILNALVLPWLRRLGRAFVRFFSSAFEVAIKKPLLTIPAVLFTNLILLRSLATSSGLIARALAAASKNGGSFLGVCAAVVQQLQSDSWVSATSDSAFALALIAVSQMVTYKLVSGGLRKVKALRRDTTGEVLQVEELNSLAMAMANPRQCGQCAFGPVDSRGCDNLRTHHGEVAVGRGRGQGAVSNACPRCGWFVPRLSQWPEWDGALHTAAGQVVFRQSLWSQMVLVVRAASKALVLPFTLLHLGKHLRLPPSLSAFFAFSYLIPWAVVNGLAICDDRGSLWSYRRRGRRPPRAAPAGGGGDDEADCGAAARRGAAQLPAVTRSQAMENILAAAPNRVFLSPGEACSVCLDAFPDEAHDTAASLRGAEAAQALQNLVPPVVALRCGHPLHVECAEAAVAAAGGHVRCPLCREPVTLAGAASARVFS